MKIKSAGSFSTKGEFKREIKEAKDKFLSGKMLFIGKKPAITFFKKITANMPEHRSSSSMVVMYQRLPYYAEWSGESKIFIQELGTFDLVGAEIK